MIEPKNIIISGASSGIGRELAISYAAKNVNLFLCARNFEKLKEVQEICNKLGANIFIEKIDVSEAKSVKKWLEKIQAKFTIDLVIANAGISAGTASGTESFKQINEIFATNINGVINIIQPIIEEMKINRQGQIAIISSLAGFRGLPSSPAYSASKAAVRIYGQALRGNLADYNIKVNVICPGFVKTPMTDANNFKMPFIMSSQKCAKLIRKGLSKNKGLIAFPKIFYFMVWFVSVLPNFITEPIFAKLPKKKSL